MPTSLLARTRELLVPHGWHREDLVTAVIVVGMGIILSFIPGDGLIEPLLLSPLAGQILMLVFGGLATALGPNLRTALVFFFLAFLSTALSGIHTFALWIGFQAVFAVVMHAPERVSVAVQRASLFVTIASGFLVVSFGAAASQGIQVGLLVAALTVIPSLWASNVREQKVLADAERARADAQERAARLAEDAAADRARLEIERARAESARDLHDLVASHVSAIALQSQAAKRTTDPARRDDIIETVHTSAVLALAELRRMIDVMRGGEAASVTSVTDTLELATAAGARVSGGEHLRELPESLETALRPIVAEVVANLMRHAATRELTIERDGHELSFSNPTTGTAQGTGYGLRNMTDRVEALGGDLRHASEAGTWTITLTLPREDPA